MIKRYEITAISKPRMTKRDRWMKRPATQKYWEYKDKIKASGMEIPESCVHITFVLPMPRSWSRKRKNHHRYQPHQQRPDKDNLEKGLLDALFNEDCKVWDTRVTKIWGDIGEIWIEPIID